MNELSVEKKVLVLSSLVEGNSIRSIERITGVNRNTIMSLLVKSGEKAQEILDRKMVNIQSNKIQVDEIWTYVGMKQKELKRQGLNDNELGDQYVFVAIDAETKLIPVFRVGKRNYHNAHLFMSELASRVNSRFQLSTDSFKPYADAVDSVFGSEIDYGQVHKQYGEEGQGEKRYSPADIIRITYRKIIGYPDRKAISTSYVERQNLTMRMQMRRFTRLTNAFSKKLENLQASLSLHFYHYNLMRIHQSLRVTPAMQAGISRHIWTWQEFLGIEKRESIAA